MNFAFLDNENCFIFSQSIQYKITTNARVFLDVIWGAFELFEFLSYLLFVLFVI